MEKKGREVHEGLSDIERAELECRLEEVEDRLDKKIIAYYTNRGDDRKMWYRGRGVRVLRGVPKINK